MSCVLLGKLLNSWSLVFLPNGDDGGGGGAGGGIYSIALQVHTVSIYKCRD